ncbi:MAG TPA: endonuclease domain-containing protein [Longimicrobium sp.]|nr:endonuclease domain-containing protein [Longimicrobium sp.]
MQQKAKELRRPMTPAEEALWAVLRRNGVADLHFRRQHAIGRFILDFYCASKRLAIEVDGPVHDEQRDYDEARTEVLQRLNIRVLRFRNEEVLSNLSSVVRRIELAVEPEQEE